MVVATVVDEQKWDALVSVDSPVGSAIVSRRVGERVTVVAPAGSWTATVTRIE